MKTDTLCECPQSNLRLISLKLPTDVNYSFVQPVTLCTSQYRKPVNGLFYPIVIFFAFVQKFEVSMELIDLLYLVPYQVIIIVDSHTSDTARNSD